MLFPSIKQPIVKNEQGYFTPQFNLDTIRTSIFTILLTRLGERVHLPEFGSRLHELLFEQQDDVFKALAEDYVIEALRAWEPRIEILSAISSFSTRENNQAEIAIQFRIRQPVPAEDSAVIKINRDTGFITGVV